MDNKLKNNWIKWKRREKHRENFNYLSYDEIQNSHHILLSLSQKESFQDEYMQLSANANLNTASKIISLNPFINESGLICVGGRLKHATIPENSKHQIILSKSHYLAELIVKDIHEKNAHIGREHTLSLFKNDIG